VLHPLGSTVPFSVVLLLATLLAVLVVTVGAAHGVALGVGVGVGVGVALGVTVAVAVAVAVGVGVSVAVGVGVGVGLIVLAVCMAIISLSDNAVFQIAACWTLPLAHLGAGVPGCRGCIKDVRSLLPPAARVAVVEATLVPSTNKVKSVPFFLNAKECQFPSKAVPGPVKKFDITVMLLPLARASACGESGVPWY